MIYRNYHNIFTIDRNYHNIIQITAKTDSISFQLSEQRIRGQQRDDSLLRQHCHALGARPLAGHGVPEQGRLVRL